MTSEVTMSRSVKGAVVVGHDGGAASDSALEWAAIDAALKGKPLLLVRAWQPPPQRRCIRPRRARRIGTPGWTARLNVSVRLSPHCT